MIRSLYSGVAGLTTHQTRMDVIGNNIANVNTYGFKASRTTFRDIYYQTSINPTGGSASFGGNNAAQVGYGVQLGSIDKDMSQSNGQSTNKVFDMMLDGDGMFMTATYSSLNLASDAGATTVRFTRMGMFGIDSYGNLASSNNVLVVGSRNSLAGLHTTGDMSSQHLNNIEIKDRNGDGMISSDDVTYRNVINMNELIQSAYNVFTDDFGYMYGYDWDALLTFNVTPGDPTAEPPTTSTIPAADGVLPGEPLIKYDLDLYGGTRAQFIEEFNGINNEDEKIEFLKQYIDVHDTLQNLEGIVDGDVLADVDDDDLPDGATVPESLTNAQYLILQARHFVDVYGNELEFNDTDIDGDGTADLTDYMDCYVYLSSATNADTLIEYKASVDHTGGQIGELTYSNVDAVNVGKDGVITVTYNSQMKDLARIEIAVFDNFDGLTEDGQTTFKDSVASGKAKIMKASDLPYTNVVSGYLEASNVNLANEFSDMIVTQRGFQANARIITTSDSMLEELVNLKR